MNLGKKIIYFIISVVTIIILIFIISWFLAEDPVIIEDPQDSADIADSSGFGLSTGVSPPVVSVDDGPSLLAYDGKRVFVRDFMQDDDTVVYTNDTVILGQEEGLDGIQYQIFYFPEDGSITVSLLSEPLHISRQLAEQELIDSLGIARKYLCGFDIWITVPGFVSEAYSGRNLGLSFCEGATILN